MEGRFGRTGGRVFLAILRSRFVCGVFEIGRGVFLGGQLEWMVHVSSNVMVTDCN